MNDPLWLDLPSPGRAHFNEPNARSPETFPARPVSARNGRGISGLSPPGEDVKVRILQTGPDRPLLAATFQGRKRDLTTRHLVAAFLGLPLVTLKVIGAIHFEAARLWLKGARWQPRLQPKLEMRVEHAARLTEGIVPGTSR
ncbi:MAG TPA: DUF1365 family protein [Pseudorhodoplanes sp.]|nr:DUF1365 family protein [Pseudorhodoplanes sp.]